MMINHEFRRKRRFLLLMFSIATSMFISPAMAQKPDLIPADQLKELVERTSGADVVVDTSRVGGKSFLNRHYEIMELPEELHGVPRYAFNGGEGERLTIRFRQSAVVFAVFEYNDTGNWSFPGGLPPSRYGWNIWRAEAYRGSSNPEKNNRPHRASVWFQEFKAGQELSQLPGWWVCAGIVNLETARKFHGFRPGLIAPSRPVLQMYSHALNAQRLHPLHVPAFDSQEAIRSWQESQRTLFIQRLVYPYQEPVSVTACDTIDRVGYREQEFRVEFNGSQLFRYFRLEPGTGSPSSALPAIVCFMGHGKVKQILDEQESYQKGCASNFARKGYLVYVMENIGMEPGTDTHHDLDRVLRLEGYGWYSLLFAHQRILLDQVFSDPMVDPRRVGVTGVSTGGLLALSAAAVEPRIAAASVQGIFGSMRVSFIKDRNGHCGCGAIPNLLPEFDLPELALLVAPRPIQFSNGSKDGFSPQEADRCRQLITPVYLQAGGKTPQLVVPEGGHAYAFEPALEFFGATLK